MKLWFFVLCTRKFVCFKSQDWDRIFLLIYNLLKSLLSLLFLLLSQERMKKFNQVPSKLPTWWGKGVDVHFWWHTILRLPIMTHSVVLVAQVFNFRCCRIKYMTTHTPKKHTVFSLPYINSIKLIKIYHIVVGEGIISVFCSIKMWQKPSPKCHMSRK